MIGKNDQEELRTIDQHFRNKNWFIASAAFFLLIATVYLIFTPENYKVYSKIMISGDKNHSQDLVIDDIKSRGFIQKAIEQLPFQVDYYEKGTFKSHEIYGDSLPIKLVFSKTNTVDSSAKVYVSVLNNQVYEIDQNDTLSDFFFNKPVSYSFAKFKGVKGPAFKKSGSSQITLKFNHPDALLEDYYKRLEVDPADDKTFQLAVTAANPEKGIDFLNKLVEVYNRSTVKPSANVESVTDNSAKIEKAEKELAILKAKATKLNEPKIAPPKVIAKAPVRKPTKSHESIQYKALEAIQPYAKSPVNQFVQIPDSYEVNDNQLEKLIAQFNKTELEKQGKLQDSQANKLNIINLNKQIASIKSSILQRITVKQNGVEGTPVSQVPAIASIQKPTLNDSAAKLNSLIKLKESEYKQLLQNKIGATLAVITKPDLIIVEKPAYHLCVWHSAGFIYFFALLIGLALPLALPFFKYLNIPSINIIDFRKLGAKFYELLHAKEID